MGTFCRYSDKFLSILSQPLSQNYYCSCMKTLFGSISLYTFVWMFDYLYHECMWLKVIFTIKNVFFYYYYYLILCTKILSELLYFQKGFLYIFKLSCVYDFSLSTYLIRHALLINLELLIFNPYTYMFKCRIILHNNLPFL